MHFSRLDLSFTNLLLQLCDAALPADVTRRAPSVPVPPHMSVLISEECASGRATVYRGQVASTGADSRTLEEVMPFWLLEYLLVNKIPPIPTVKVSFILLPYKGKDPSDEQLPELLNTYVILPSPSSLGC